jgi:hypothetical protein
LKLVRVIFEIGENGRAPAPGLASAMGAEIAAYFREELGWKGAQTGLWHLRFFVVVWVDDNFRRIPR